MKMQEWYSSGYYPPKRMTKRQIQEMIKNMKKSKVITDKSNKYHEKDEDDAENILKKLYNN